LENETLLAAHVPCLLDYFAGVGSGDRHAIGPRLGDDERTGGHDAFTLPTGSTNGITAAQERREWSTGSPLCPLLEETSQKYRYFEDGITDTTKGGKQLTLRFKSDFGGLLSLMLRVYPMGAVIEFAAELENQGQHALPLLSRIDPLRLSLKIPAGGLKPYSSVQEEHGFHRAGVLSTVREFSTGSCWRTTELVNRPSLAASLAGHSRLRATTETSQSNPLHTGNILPSRDTKQSSMK
jgi:hypothetical protein